MKIKKSNTVVLCMMLIMFIHGCGTKEDIFYVEDAALIKREAHKNYLNQVKLHGSFKFEEKDDLLMQKGHIITNGQGTVIAFRSVIRPIRSLLYTSNEFYQNISINIPMRLSDKGEIKISPNGEVIVFFSKGNLAYPDQTGCSGYAKEGRVNWIRDQAEKLKIVVEFKADMVSHWRLSEEHGECIPNPFVFKKSLLIEQKKMDEANKGVWFTDEHKSDSEKNQGHARRK